MCDCGTSLAVLLLSNAIVCFFSPKRVVAVLCTSRISWKKIKGDSNSRDKHCWSPENLWPLQSDWNFVWSSIIKVQHTSLLLYSLHLISSFHHHNRAIDFSSTIQLEKHSQANQVRNRTLSTIYTAFPPCLMTSFQNRQVWLMDKMFSFRLISMPQSRDVW